MNRGGACAALASSIAPPPLSRMKLKLATVTSLCGLANEVEAVKLRWYGWFGLGVLIVAEAALILNVEIVRVWFTPIMWTGYIMLVDALVLRLRGESLITSRPRDFFLMLWLSIFWWLTFELYNLRLMNWYYINLPASPVQRNLGFAWAFATIFPGIFETTELLEALYPFDRIRIPARPWPQQSLILSVIVGFLFVTIPPALPFLVSRYLFGFVWLGYIFLADPLNYWLGAPSLLHDWEEGRPGRMVALLAGGAVCGILWEFWNYWALTKWIYAVPILSDIKLFEMPVLGFLGFPPFALECYALYNLSMRLLLGRRMFRKGLHKCS
jgi:hypothetical protein